MKSLRDLTAFKAMFAGVLLSLMLGVGAGTLFAQAAPVRGESGAQGTPAANSTAAAEGEKDETAEYRHSKMVQSIGHMVGMNAEQASTTFEVLNFAVLALLVGGFLIKALPKVFRDRTSSLQKHLVDARAAQEEASARMNSIEDRLSQLDGQIDDLRQKAEQATAADEVRIKASVEEEKVKIVAAAEAEIAAASMYAQRELQRYAAELAIEQAARKLVISAETDRLLVQDFARKLGGGDVKGGQN